MKSLISVSLVLAALLASGMVSARAQGTAFTYQGRLRDNNIPAEGVFDLRFALYTTEDLQVGSTVSIDDVAVSNGLFCVTLDFGVNAFNGSDRWLETSLRPGAEQNPAPYTALTPRRRLTATPYAMYATTAGSAGTASSMPAANLTGTIPLAILPGEVVINHETGVTLSGKFSGDGAGLVDLNAGKLIGVAPKAAEFTGLLQGDVTGNQGSTVVARVAGVTADAVASGASAANAATVAPSPNTLVKRDAAGGFVAGSITASFVGSGSGLTALDASQLTSGTVQDSRLSDNARAAIESTKGATSAGTPDTLVKRDGNGAFSGNVTGTFAGDGSRLTNIPASSIVGTGGGGGTTLLPPGITVVSMLPNDPSLLANGFVMMMTVPAPPWVTSWAAASASARFGHSAVWDGKRLIVWGGRPVLGAVYLDSGASYFPEADKWEPVSPVDAPTARWGHTAVWSGTEMIVWGGNAETGRLNTGGRFQPDAQIWRAIRVAGAPGARTDHVAVWTGTKMLIWGGQNASGLLNDGGFYAPDTDAWSGLSTVGAPTARIGATAIWAGDRVLIWGGEGGSGALDTGSQLRFDAAAPYWVAISLSKAPSPRRGHSAIWTGSRMIVWGGQRGGVPCRDGAAYDPATDSWESLPEAGSPTARSNHAAVWTGQEMLVLGGSNGAGEFASGAAYNPATSVWRPLSTSGSPLPRTEATAAWSGTEVLIFGGQAHGSAVASLQRLVPQPVWYFYRKL